MKTLSELYDFLEDKRDDKHIDGLLSYDAALPEEWQKARLEMLTWWKIERPVFWRRGDCREKDDGGLVRLLQRRSLRTYL